MSDRPANTTGKAVSSPGRGSKRTDLNPSNRPMRIATGQAYGSSKQQEQMQQARQQPPSSATPPQPAQPAAPTPSGAQAGAGMDPRAILKMVGAHPTQFPGDPIGRPSQTRRPSQISAEEASMALEMLVANAAGGVSQSTLSLLNDLKREALYSPSMSFDGEDIADMDGLV